jgi:cyclic pyranopterin phosphate synthase
MIRDTLSRPLEDLRISITDRCNFRCSYCMPFEEYDWVPHREILTFEEVHRLASIFISLGVRRIRITGGEPLIRADVERLVSMLAGLEDLEDLSMTTNASLLAGKARALRDAGLRRVNISLDTVDPETFREMTRHGDVAKVLEGIAAAKACGLKPIKLNAVVERGLNDHQILDLVDFARDQELGLRFIEYMDVGTANRWSLEKLVSREEILQVIGSRYPIQPVERDRGAAPAQDYVYEDGKGEVGVIASVSAPFCGDCSRARLTAEGQLVTCLFASKGSDLKQLVRGGAEDEEIRDFISSRWRKRADRYSEERREALESSGGYKADGRGKIEMIRLGG